MLYGPPGVAKTTSIILYSYLNYVISSYEFEYDEIIAPNLQKILYLSYEKTDS
jgi:hypothetical protein